MSFSVVAIASVKRNDYGIHFWYMGENEAINIIKTSYKNIQKILYCKWWNTYYQRKKIVRQSTKLLQSRMW